MRGQATVEFALCLPVIAILLALILQAAITVRTQILVVEASREGARAAARDVRPGAAERAAGRVAGLDPGRLVVEVGETAGADGGEIVVVTVRYRSRPVVPLVNLLVSELELRSVVGMQRE